VHILPNLTFELGMEVIRLKNRTKNKTKKKLEIGKTKLEEPQKKN
jgi:hypothetical protein